jgi:hypothetical protein
VRETISRIRGAGATGIADVSGRLGVLLEGVCHRLPRS